MHRNIVFVHASTLAETKYKLKTSMGVSEAFIPTAKPSPFTALAKEVAILQPFGAWLVPYCFLVMKTKVMAHISAPPTNRCPSHFR